MTLNTSIGLVPCSISDIIVKVICETLKCEEPDICNIQGFDNGCSNYVFSFEVAATGKRYVFRYPGDGNNFFVDRRRESVLQNLAFSYDIDKTLIKIHPDEGWRLSRYLNCRHLDYSNSNDVKLAMSIIRKLHTINNNESCEVDLRKVWTRLRDEIPVDKYGGNIKGLSDFNKVSNDIEYLYEMAEKDAIQKCMVHGDCKDENFLIDEDGGINLIDWEFSGYCDPGYDIGGFICGTDGFEIEDVESVLCYYYDGVVFDSYNRRHMYAYIAITAFFYLHFIMFKESIGLDLEHFRMRLYKYARKFGAYAMSLYM